MSGQTRPPGDGTDAPPRHGEVNGGCTNQRSAIQIGRDASGNTLITGNQNTVHMTVYLQQREAPPEPAQALLGPNPYRGLSAFHEDDRLVFFGREALTQELWQRFQQLYEQPDGLRLLPILGPSGSGKSSVARAGLLPALVDKPPAGLRRLRALVMTPGSHPLEALGLMLARIATSEPAPVGKARELTAELRLRGPDGAADGLRRIAEAALHHGSLSARFRGAP